MLREAADEVTAFADFPVSHWKKICSTNPLERLNKEIKRRTDGASTPANGASRSRSARCGVSLKRPPRCSGATGGASGGNRTDLCA